MASKKRVALVAPYVPFSTFMTALEKLASHGLPSKIDRSIFPTFNGVFQGQLLGALRFLALIDDEGVPQSIFRDLVTEDEVGRKKTLRVILEGQYENLRHVDLMKITPPQFDQLIGEYGVTGATRRKAKSFFLKAAKWTGTKVSPLLLSKTRKTTIKRNGTRSTRKKGQAPNHSSPEPKSEERYSKSIHLPGAGGTLTVSGTFDPFALHGKERELVYGITDEMTAFEKTGALEESTDAEDAVPF